MKTLTRNLLMASLLWVLPAAAISNQVVDTEIHSIKIEGLEGTRSNTVEDLLPRPIPATYTAAELSEFRRRVKNLALFDQVDIRQEGGVLVISVRHKATLAPVVALSSGKTLRDSTVTLGFVEHDISGKATRLRVQGSYSERGPNLLGSLTQHPYSPNRWATEYQASYSTSGFRFETGSSNWTRNRIGGMIEWISPFLYTSRLQFELALIPYYEFSGGTTGTAPDSGFNVGGLFEIIYDNFHWDDLTPSGQRFVFELRPGFFTGRESFRGESRVKLISSTGLWENAVFVVNANLALTNTGNPNHSLLLGSQQGVRGLPDSLYRNFAQGFGNFELRQAFPVYKRWFLQPAVFADLARFNSMDSNGVATQWRSAASTGVGIRIIPTGLVHSLLRIDVAKLHLPTEAWLVQGGITQYF